MKRVREEFGLTNLAVKKVWSILIRQAHAAGKKIRLCSQAPLDYPEFAAFLVGEDIDSISSTPDALARTI